MALCEKCGLDHHPAPEPEVIVDAGPNENSVEIAKIEAKASLAREQLYTEQERGRLDSEIAALRAENDALRNPVASTITVETEAEPEPEAEPEVVLAEEEPPETSGSPVPREKKKSGWWDNYK